MVKQDLIRKQVEFYFSDSNLPSDRFLKDAISKQEEGFVPISLLCTFSRMRKLLGLSNTDKIEKTHLDEVVAALKSSAELLLSSDEDLVKRVKPITSDNADLLASLDQRSVHATPFPYTSNLEELAEFFNKHSEVKSLRMQKKLKMFAGSVFVEFSSKEEAAKVLSKELVYEGAALRMLSKMEYLQKLDAENANHAELQQEKSKISAEKYKGCVCEAKLHKPLGLKSRLIPGSLREALEEETKNNVVWASLYESEAAGKFIIFSTPESAQAAIAQSEKGDLSINGVKLCLEMMEDSKAGETVVKALSERTRIQQKNSYHMGAFATPGISNAKNGEKKEDSGELKSEPCSASEKRKREDGSPGKFGKKGKIL